MIEFLVAFYLQIFTYDALLLPLMMWLLAVKGGYSDSPRLERATLGGYQAGALIHGIINVILLILAFYFTWDAQMIWHDILFYTSVFLFFIISDYFLYRFYKNEIVEMMNLLPKP